MKMEQPKIDFVELQMDNILTESSGSSIGICQKAGDSYKDCTNTGSIFNYGEQPGEDCGGDTLEFDY